VKDFLDFTVARAGRGGRFLRPRVAHRFGPPEHHIAASDDPLGADRANGDGVPPEGDSAGPRDAPGVPLTEVGRSPGGKARAETSWSRAQTGGATRGGAVPAGEGRGGPALPSFAAEPTAELARGPAAASVSAPTNDSPAQDNFVERLPVGIFGYCVVEFAAHDEIDVFAGIQRFVRLDVSVRTDERHFHGRVRFLDLSQQLDIALETHR